MNSLRASLLILVISTLSLSPLHAQQGADTVIVPLAETSRIIFTVQDRADLETLRHYDFQALFDDVLQRLGAPRPEREISAGDDGVDTLPSGSRVEAGGEDTAGACDVDEHKWTASRKGGIGETWQRYNVDLGTNNYLSGDQFPNGGEPFAVRPWGSWYIASNSVQRTRLGRNVFVEWGMGVSWYNFKFQEDDVVVLKEEAGVAFETDTRNVDFIKSKLSATFVNVSLVPVLDFGGHSHRHRIWDGDGSGFRLGVGPYVGYRISSKTKVVYESGGEREKEKERDNFYLNGLRYGMRIQIGVRSTDLFVNYDMNELFVAGKGPRLNAVSFGIVL